MGDDTDKPAPARPEYVKVTDMRGGKKQPLTVGKVYRVEEWLEPSGRPYVKNDRGELWYLSDRGAESDSKRSTFASWVPADSPAPFEPTDAQVEAAWKAFGAETGGPKDWARAALKAAWAVKS